MIQAFPPHAFNFSLQNASMIPALTFLPDYKNNIRKY
jgi:hypothetical protein